MAFSHFPLWKNNRSPDILLETNKFLHFDKKYIDFNEFKDKQINK